ncbi:MAG: FkbM family methyltransferase [Oscillospiraceae bacterium]|nr:FkbM family methyltransferase [Oscillospiraceae bacterium]
MPNELPLWEYLKTTPSPIILYGTGDGADKVIAVMERHGLTPSAIMASDDFVRGQSFKGFDVLKFEEVKKRFTDFIILTCFGTDREDVLGNIIKLSERYEIYAPDLPLFGEDIYDVNYVEKHGEKLSKARGLLSDEKSRHVFDNWLEYRLSGRIDILEEIATPRDEDLSLLNLKDNELFIDAGAFKGDTVDEFLKHTNSKFNKIIAIEPDAKNYIWLKRRFYAYGIGLFLPVNAAAWNTDGTVNFSAKTGRAGSLTGTGRQIEIASVKIDTLCIDENSKPTFIKIDTEGSEAKVIEGAKNVISRHKPKLLISLYHRPEDMYELPILLNSINPKYKMYLRKTRCLPGWEFNLFAI